MRHSLIFIDRKQTALHCFERSGIDVSEGKVRIVPLPPQAACIARIVESATGPAAADERGKAIWNTVPHSASLCTVSRAL